MTKIYPRSVKFFALILYAAEIIFLVCLAAWVFSQRGKNILGASVVMINKENVVMRPEKNLEHYYEWASHQVIKYTTEWLPQPIMKRTNDDGIIGDTDYPVEKARGMFRIIAIGDSFTEGMYVGLQDTYPAKLETILNAMNSCPKIKEYQVMNLGVGGYDLEYSAHRLVTRGVKYSPDLVIWLVKDDDFVQRAEVEWGIEQEYFRYVNEDLGGNLNDFPLYKQWAKELHKGGGLHEIIHQIAVKEQLTANAHRDYIPYQESAIDTVVNSASSPIVMMTFKETNSEFRARMLLWEKTKRRVHFFGDLPTLRDEQENFEPNDGHANAAGNQKIAMAAYQELQKRGLLCIKD